MAPGGASERDIIARGHKKTNSAVATGAGSSGSLIHTGKAKLHAVVINQPDISGTIAIYDGTSFDGTLIASITGGTAVQTTLTYNVRMATGIYASFTAFTGDLTWSYMDA